MDTKTDLNLNNIIPTLSLISISSVKQFTSKCPDTYSNLISTPLDGCQSLSIDAQSYPALPSQSLRATIGPLQDNWPLFHHVIGISGILPYNRNVTLQTLELFSTYAQLYNAAASPASRLRSAGSLAIINHLLAGPLGKREFCFPRILRPVHTSALTPAARSCNTLSEQSSLVCTNDF